MMHLVLACKIDNLGRCGIVSIFHIHTSAPTSTVVIFIQGLSGPTTRSIFSFVPHV